MNDGPAYAMVMSAVGDAAAADALAESLVAARLAACVQILPVRSVYRWKGRMEKSGEQLLFVKTRAALTEKTIAWIRERHPYEIPEIVALPIQSGWRPYLDWIDAETRGEGRS
jgi:periplasmic divalent cation tolerance protein